MFFDHLTIEINHETLHRFIDLRYKDLSKKENYVLLDLYTSGLTKKFEQHTGKGDHSWSTLYIDVNLREIEWIDPVKLYAQIVELV